MRINTKSTNRSVIDITVDRLDGDHLAPAAEYLAAEQPLEIQLTYGSGEDRTTKPISVTMRTPGDDAALAAGFLYTEGVIRDAADIHLIAEGLGHIGNVVRVELQPDVTLNLGSLQRNFYTTSSCGICGKASILALQSVCPPRSKSRISIDADVLYTLLDRMRDAQKIFAETGGLHGAALADAQGKMHSVREDVGRHNAVDKLVGAALLADELPLRDYLLLLSGRISFELMQKALMSGISMVAAVGAPSSLAVQVAKEFDMTLIGFVRSRRCNIYHGAEHVCVPAKCVSSSSGGESGIRTHVTLR